jgi:nucleotide-binding universal stress UspA family protein
MFRRILVPLDGTLGSEHTLPWALAIAERAGGTVTLARVHHAMGPVAPGTEIAGDLVLDENLRLQERDYLARIANHLQCVSDVPVSWELLEGAPAEELCRFAGASGADLVVMTTHGRGPFGRLLLGSVADVVVRKVQKPTLLIRPPAEGAIDLAARPTLSDIFVPLDGSELAEQILEPAAGLARLMGAHLTLLTVAEGKGPEEAELVEYVPAMPHYTAPEAGRQNALGYLGGVAERLRTSVADVGERVLVSHPVSEAILSAVHSPADSVIALATHGRGGLARLALGSVADAIIRRANYPVLVYRPGPLRSSA